MKETGQAVDFEPVVKLVLPGTASAWLLTEIDPDRPDWGYGLCDLGFGSPELGTVLLSDLEELTSPAGDHAQAVPHWLPAAPLSLYARAARKAGRIIEISWERDA